MMELKLQMRRLELDHERESNEREQQKERKLQEREQRQKEFEMQLQYQERCEREERDMTREKRDVARAREERQHQLELRKLEFQASQTHPVAAPRYSCSGFRVESAVKLIPRFNENDVETFLISFEKIAQLNNFPEDKYAAVLQANLTGKALRVFTERSIEQCQDYPTLKAALLTAYAVVPEIYRKRFLALSKYNSEAYCEFAFRLSTQFKRWTESEYAYGDIEKLRELFMMEEFNDQLESNMRGWLIDQKPKTLGDLSKLADQYVAIHRAD